MELKTEVRLYIDCAQDLQLSIKAQEIGLYCESCGSIYSGKCKLIVKGKLDQIMEFLNHVKGEQVKGPEITPDLLHKLETKAILATNTFWQQDDQRVVYRSYSNVYENEFNQYEIAKFSGRSDAAFVAMANPATVLRMIKNIRVLKKALEMATGSDFMGGGPVQNDPEFWIDHASKQLESDAAGE